MKEKNQNNRLLNPSLEDSNMNKKSKKSPSSEHKKISRPKIAVGGFDQDLNNWNSSFSGEKKLSKKKLALKKQHEKDFTEFNPSMMLKKGGKPGTSSFKSKSKFKRRK